MEVGQPLEHPQAQADELPPNERAHALQCLRDVHEHMEVREHRRGPEPLQRVQATREGVQRGRKDFPSWAHDVARVGVAVMVREREIRDAAVPLDEARDVGREWKGRREGGEAGKMRRSKEGAGRPAVAVILNLQGEALDVLHDAEKLDEPRDGVPVKLGADRNGQVKNGEPDARGGRSDVEEVEDRLEAHGLHGPISSREDRVVTLSFFRDVAQTSADAREGVNVVAVVKIFEDIIPYFEGELHVRVNRRRWGAPRRQQRSFRSARFSKSE